MEFALADFLQAFRYIQSKQQIYYMIKSIFKNCVHKNENICEIATTTYCSMYILHANNLSMWSMQIEHSCNQS